MVFLKTNNQFCLVGEMQSEDKQIKTFRFLRDNWHPILYVKDQSFFLLLRFSLGNCPSVQYFILLL
jgi:hypothetical protein